MGATITILLCAALTLAGMPFLLIGIILFILFFRNRHNGTAQTKRKFTAACISVFIGALLISPLLDVISMITIDNPLFILLAGLLLISSLLIYFVYIFIKKCKCVSLSNKTLIGFAVLYFITILLCVPLAAGITILRIVNSGA